MTTQNESEFDLIDPNTGEPIVEDNAEKAPETKPEKDEQKPTEPKSLPDKLKDKSAEEIANMYLELEGLQGRQAQELGSLRKSVNDIIQREFEQAKSSKEADVMEAELEYGELIDDPKNAIKKAVKSDIDDVRDELNKFRTQQALEKFTQKHPDFKEVVQTTEFANWVQESPFRVRTYYAADAGDLEAADDLISEFKNISVLKSKDNNDQKRSKALKGAMSEPSGATASQGRTKKYRSSDLVNLRVNNPTAYEANRAEYEAAYVEGRVIKDI